MPELFIMSFFPNLLKTEPFPPIHNCSHDPRRHRQVHTYLQVKPTTQKPSTSIASSSECIFFYLHSHRTNQANSIWDRMPETWDRYQIREIQLVEPTTASEKRSRRKFEFLLFNQHDFYRRCFLYGYLFHFHLTRIILIAIDSWLCDTTIFSLRGTRCPEN